MDALTALLTGVGLVLTYTGTLVVACMWLAGKFDDLKSQMVDKVAWAAQSEAWRMEFRDIDKRLRAIELWQAGQTVLKIKTHQSGEPIP